MRLTTNSALLTAVLLVPMIAAAQQVPLKPGKYEVTTTTTLRGQLTTPDKKTRCISAEQLSNVEGVFNIRPMAGLCKVGAVTFAAGKVSYAADCPNSAARVEGTVGAGAYSVVRTLTPKSANAPAVVSKFEGKWVGPCESPRRAP